MSTVGQRETFTQQRVVAFFENALGNAYLGHWKDREGSSNVEEVLLTDWLRRQGHGHKIIAKVLHELGKVAALGGSKRPRGRSAGSRGRSPKDPWRQEGGTGGVLCRHVSPEHRCSVRTHLTPMQRTVAWCGRH